MNIIEVSQLKKRYTYRDVLSSIDLRVESGSILGLVGTNGSGKSTLLKCILGLLKADEGKSTVLGDDSWNLSAKVKGRIGYVSQLPNFYPWMAVVDLVDYFGAFYPTWDRAWSRKLLRRWELPNHTRFKALSPGLRQRLAMVVALGHHPELLVLDEPVASLDPIARRESLKQLIEVAQDGEHTIVYSSHILSDLERIASHVAILAHGTIVCSDDLDRLKDRFKRIRLTKATSWPTDFSIPDALKVTIVDKEVFATVTSLSDGFLERMKQDWSCELQIEDLNLEEIFLEVSEPRSSS